MSACRGNELNIRRGGLDPGPPSEKPGRKNIARLNNIFITILILNTCAIFLNWTKVISKIQTKVQLLNRRFLFIVIIVKNGGSTNQDIKLGQLTKSSKPSLNVLRRSTRIPYQKKLKYGMLNNQTTGDSDALKFSGFTFNVSEHGIGIEGKQGFPPKFKIQASLFTGEKTLRFEGIIKWLHRSDTGKWYMGIEVTSRMDSIREIYSNLTLTSGLEF